MADVVDTLVLDTSRLSKRKQASPWLYYAVRLLNISDGTGESGVIKVDKSTLVAFDGAEPAKLAVEEILCSIQGFTSVRLYWHHDVNDEICVLSGNDYRNYSEVPLVDPASAGGTGDILLTTAGTTSGNTYDITLILRLMDN